MGHDQYKNANHFGLMPGRSKCEVCFDPVTGSGEAQGSKMSCISPKPKLLKAV